MFPWKVRHASPAGGREGLEGTDNEAMWQELHYYATTGLLQHTLHIQHRGCMCKAEGREGPFRAHIYCIRAVLFPGTFGLGLEY